MDDQSLPRGAQQRALRRLEGLRLEYGPEAAAAKRAALEAVAGARFATADALQRYHELLCFMAAYPDDARLLGVVRRELRAFSLRPDLARHREALADSGIAGTATHYNFFWMMSRWLVKRLPRRLSLDWSNAECAPRLAAALPVLLDWIKAEAVKRSPLEPQAILECLRGRRTDAEFILGLVERMPGDDFTREHFHDAVDSAYVLAPANGFPSRTLARHAAAPIAFRRTRPSGTRPDLVRELARKPAGVRRVEGAEARTLVELAREAMLTRARDLVAFSWGDERDVTLVDDGDGLAFAIIGSLPERRLPLPAVHGWIILRNRVPVGYVQTDTLLAGSELSFNVFPTFRGVEAGYLFARVLATARQLLGARAFSLEPYQLGDGNAEGIESGAWWFYYKLGFRPIALGPQRLLASELERMRRRPEHRSSIKTLKGLTAGHMVFEPEPGCRAWLPLMPGLGLARQWQAGEVCDAIARNRFDVGSLARWSNHERMAWLRLAPILATLQGAETWSATDKRRAVAAVRAKGGRFESDFVRRVDAHRPLAGALQRLLRASARQSADARPVKPAAAACP